MDLQPAERKLQSPVPTSMFYSPFSSPFASPCPSPSFSSSPCPSPSFPSPTNSSPASSPLPFLHRSASSPSFGALFSDSPTPVSLPPVGGPNPFLAGVMRPSASVPASPFGGRVSPSISFTPPSPAPSVQPQAPNSAFATPQASAFSPVRRKSHDYSSSSSSPSPLISEKSPNTKKRINEESRLSSAFENWSLGSEDDSNDSSSSTSVSVRSSPIISRQKKKKTEEQSFAASKTPQQVRKQRREKKNRELEMEKEKERRMSLEAEDISKVLQRSPQDSGESADDEGFGDDGDKDDSRRRRATPEQVFILEQVFEMNPLPTAATKKELAKRIGMSHRQIQVWFQNKRARMKRMGHTPKSKDPFVFHHLAVCEDGEFSLKAEGYLPEEVESLLPVPRKK